MPDALRQLRPDGLLEILTTTKEQGSWSQYIEVGRFTTDAFGDEVFTRAGYAKAFTGIQAIRKYEGRGAGTYCRWILRLVPDFPYVIRQVTNPGGAQRERTYDILFQPPQKG